MTGVADLDLARVLRDPDSAIGASIDVHAYLTAARRHRVLLLLGWRLRESGALRRWPAAFVDAFLEEERQAIAVDCIRQHELTGALAALADAGANVLVIKGAATAHSHYPAPHVRVRADTDLLVASADPAIVDRVVTSRGYVRPTETSGQFVSYQQHYQRPDGRGVTHAFDVHWKISNLQSLADRLDHGELWQRRVPVPTLGPAATTVDGADALLLALLHRAGHHAGSRNLLWLYDLRLLAQSLTDEQRRRFVDAAIDRGVAGIAVEGLSAARDCFGGESMDALITALHGRAWRPDDLPVPAASMTQAAVLGLDLRALPTWRSRVRLLREHTLPPAAYMRARYGVRSNAWLPALYLWRVMSGMPKWIARRAPES